MRYFTEQPQNKITNSPDGTSSEQNKFEFDLQNLELCLCVNNIGPKDVSTLSISVMTQSEVLWVFIAAEKLLHV